MLALFLTAEKPPRYHRIQYGKEWTKYTFRKHHLGSSKNQ
jgi:hypothetical protein